MQQQQKNETYKKIMYIRNERVYILYDLTKQVAWPYQLATDYVSSGFGRATQSCNAVTLLKCCYLISDSV